MPGLPNCFYFRLLANYWTTTEHDTEMSSSLGQRSSQMVWGQLENLFTFEKCAALAVQMCKFYWHERSQLMLFSKYFTWHFNSSNKTKEKKQNKKTFICCPALLGNDVKTDFEVDNQSWLANYKIWHVLYLIFPWEKLKIVSFKWVDVFLDFDIGKTVLFWVSATFFPHNFLYLPNTKIGRNC